MIIQGTTIGLIKGDTRSLDYGTCRDLLGCMNLREVQLIRTFVALLSLKFVVQM